MMTNDEQASSLIDRMCREALDRLARSIGTKVGIAKARLREAAAAIRAEAGEGARREQ
jgi:hypothetical protein